MYELIFHPKVEDEFANSFDWYEEQKEGLGERFLLSVDEALVKVKNNPLHYQVRRGKLRQALTDVFPFVICFKVDQKKKVIYISAIFHTSRHPKHKLRK